MPRVRSDLSKWVVAVLDTGVAYIEWKDSNLKYAQAPSLARVNFTSPYDFVNDDTHPGDDHQHGTHMASLIASEGEISGVAAGVSIMPVKVLDRNNQGNELALIDGLYWATKSGADVVNMSLSFPLGYVPSSALVEALDYAADAGVVMVAAAGNSALASVTWPAASPDVIAVVGGQQRDPSGDPDLVWSDTPVKPASYANIGSAADVTAAGGDLTADLNADGLADGLLAETIELNDPSTTGSWLFEGSSPAAAVVSGAVVHLLDAGAPATAIPTLLQRSALTTAGGAGDPFKSGGGAGALNISGGAQLWGKEGASLLPATGYHVALLPFLLADTSQIQPAARVTVVDDLGQPVAGAVVLGTLWDADGPRQLDCTVATWKTDDDGEEEDDDKTASGDRGSCVLYGDQVDSTTTSTWAFGVEGVVMGDVAHRPGKAIFASDGAEALFRAIDAEATFSDAALAIHWSSGQDSELGVLAEAVAVVDLGTGPTGTPLALLFVPEAVEEAATVTTLSIDLDGTGISSSPLGFTDMTLFAFDGTGLSSSPLGFGSLVAIDGTGLSSSPLGFHPLDLVSEGAGAPITGSTVGFAGEALLLGPQEAVGVAVDGTALGELLSSDGVRTAEVYEGASHVIGSGVVEVGWSEK